VSIVYFDRAPIGARPSVGPFERHAATGRDLLQLLEFASSSEPVSWNSRPQSGFAVIDVTNDYDLSCSCGALLCHWIDHWETFKVQIRGIDAGSNELLREATRVMHEALPLRLREGGEGGPSKPWRLSGFLALETHRTTINKGPLTQPSPLRGEREYPQQSEGYPKL